MEGAEYVHYAVFLESDGKTLIKNIKVEDFRGMTREQIASTHGMGSHKFYEKYSESFGKEGRGVKYSYFIKDSRDGSFNSAGSSFDKSGGTFSHGLYFGAGSTTEQGNRASVPPGSPQNQFTYTETAIDEVDALAQIHDKTYEEAGAEDFHSDPRGIKADVDFVVGLRNYLDRASQEGYVDAITGRPPSKEAISHAKTGIIGFSTLMPNKLLKKAKEIESRPQ